MGNQPPAAPLIDSVRTDWRNNPRTQLAWQRSADQTGNAQGECRGEFVEAGGLAYKGYLKPGNTGNALWAWPLAAYEKIAADLAFDLNCPVQQAQTWERANAPAGYVVCACVSLKEFPQYWAWSVVSATMAQPTVQNEPVRQILGSVLARASGMLVLDTWLGQSDRADHPNNVMFGYDPYAAARSKLVYLDFGRILNWNGGWSNDGWRNIQVTAQPALVIQSLDQHLARQTLDRVMAMEEGQIAEICERLICPHFTQPQAELIRVGLIGRRGLLRTTLGPLLGIN